MEKCLWPKGKGGRMKPLTLTLCIPVMNQLHDCRSALGLFRYNTSEDTEFCIIDNGSTDPYEDFIVNTLKPKKLNFIRNESNIGMIKTIQQAYENCTTDILAVTHNDVFLYEKDWDKRILKYFEEMPDLGGIGTFGSQGVGPRGERIQDVPRAGMMAGWSNMLEAEVHGMRLYQDWVPASIFDGFFMAFRMDVLKKSGGIDQRYQYHHFYDRSLSLQSLALGYKNIVVNIPCHHWSGMTANRAEYQTWINKELSKEAADSSTHDQNMALFEKIWGDVLPLYVENDFSFRKGQQGTWDFKGNSIVGYDWRKPIK